MAGAEESTLLKRKRSGIEHPRKKVKTQETDIAKIKSSASRNDPKVAQNSSMLSLPKSVEISTLTKSAGQASSESKKRKRRKHSKMILPDRDSGKEAENLDEGDVLKEHVQSASAVKAAKETSPTSNRMPISLSKLGKDDQKEQKKNRGSRRKRHQEVTPIDKAIGLAGGRIPNADEPAPAQLPKMKEKKKAEDKNRLKTSEKHREKHKSKSTCAWIQSQPQGGWFLPKDPIFSPDEKYLLLPKLRALEIYTSDDSLLVQELSVGKGPVILSCALSAVNAQHVYVADSSGIVTLWNWTNKSKLGRWAIDAQVRHMAVIRQPDSDGDLLYACEAGSRQIVNVHALRLQGQDSKTELKMIKRTDMRITGIQVLQEGGIVIVTSANTISIGKRLKATKTAVQDFDYVWQEFTTPKRISAFCAQEVAEPAIDGAVRPQHRAHLNLAYGDEEGALLVYEDVMAMFATIERVHKGNNIKAIGLETFRPKRLHWHRTAVRSVKWSLDGNYLISGGDETVLVLWQISTGKQQHLPHLGAAIENITVSPSGTAYGLNLANNSVIVISTSELKAKTNIVGLQARRLHASKLIKDARGVDQVSQWFRPVAMTANATDDGRLIFATPSSQALTLHPEVLPEPYIHTYDLSARRPMGRQALTRNNATDLNVGPDGRKISEPNIILLENSCDGTWLASVDEWSPTTKDLEYLVDEDPSSQEEECRLRREVYLKFWRWDEKGSQWALETRIDAPHIQEGLAAHARVLDLTSDPSHAGFATIGEDKVVRIWRPKTRMRDGLVVRGAARKEGLVTWTLSQSVTLADHVDADATNISVRSPSTISSCRLAFSPDGSTLAVGLASSHTTGIIHIMDVETGTIRRTLTELDVGRIAGVGIINRYLVVVGTSIAVWDLVLDCLSTCLPLDPSATPTGSLPSLTRLAVNHVDGTFAVSVPHFKGKVSTKIYVFDPSAPSKPWNCSIADMVVGLVSSKRRAGFITLDASATIRTIDPRFTGSQLPTPPPERRTPLLVDNEASIDESIGPADDHKLEQRDGTSDTAYLSPDNEKPVVRLQQLQEVFDRAPSYALPSIGAMFDAVATLYARKPRLVS